MCALEMFTMDQFLFGNDENIYLESTHYRSQAPGLSRSSRITFGWAPTHGVLILPFKPQGGRDEEQHVCTK